MLRIYVCEDNAVQRQKIVTIITKTICIEDYDMELALSTGSPAKLLECLRQTPMPGIYFLDIDLKSDINGIELASAIREFDPRGFIIFITTMDHFLPDTFKYKVEAMDFISKNTSKDLSGRIISCLKRANDLYTAPANTVHKVFRFKIGSQIMTLPMDEVTFFEPSPTSHRIIAHTLNGAMEFYGTLKNLSAQADDRFLLSHRKCLVNREHVSSVDFSTLTIHFHNGDTCQASARLIKQFKL